MAQVLSLDLRPRALSRMIGQEKLVKAIRNHYASGREPRAWMFIGDTGSGKTTLARIIALSLQCTHQTEFGEPCKDCIEARTDFNIDEINASEVSGVEAVGQIAQNSNYTPLPPSRRRVFILDEAHQLSSASQNLLLKYFEDSPKTTVWIICTTEPQKILRTLRGRCLSYVMNPLSMKATQTLLDRAMKKLKSDKDTSELFDQFMAQKISSPRLILMALEKFLAGSTAEEAVMGGEASVDTLKICKAVIKGDWESIAAEMGQADPNAFRVARAAVASYLKTVMLTSQGTRANAAADAIEMLAQTSRTEESMQAAYTLAVLRKITMRFVKS